MYAYQLAILVEVCVIVRHLMRRFIETATTIAIASHTVPVICVALFDVDCVPADIATHSADSSSNFVMEWRYTKYRQTLSSTIEHAPDAPVENPLFVTLSDEQLKALGVPEELKGYRSLTHGDMPVVEKYETYADEIAALVKHIQEKIDSGIDPVEICVVARTNKMLADYASALTERLSDGNRLKQIHGVRFTG